MESSKSEGITCRVSRESQLPEREQITTALIQDSLWAARGVSLIRAALGRALLFLWRNSVAGLPHLFRLSPDRAFRDLL